MTTNPVASSALNRGVQRLNDGRLVRRIHRAAVAFFALLLPWFAATPSAGEAPAGKGDAEISGKLLLRFNDCFNPGHQGHGSEYVVWDAKTRHETALDVAAVDVAKLTPGRMVRVKGRPKDPVSQLGRKGRFVVGEITYEPQQSSAMAGTEAAGGTGESGGGGAAAAQGAALTKLSVLVIHAKTPDKAVNSTKVTTLDHMLFGGTENASEAIKHASYGHYSLVQGDTIVVDLDINAVGTDYGVMVAAMENAAIASGHDPADYDRYMVCCPDGTRSGGKSDWTAYGYYGSGKTVWSYAWTAAYFDGLVHELGHNFGFPHSGKGGNAYDDGTCVMGYSHANTSARAATYSVVKKVQANWFAPFPGSHASITGDATYDLYPISISPETAPGMRAVQIDGTDYYISYRRYLMPYGWLEDVNDADKVLVHTNTAFESDSWRVADLTAGTSYNAGSAVITFERHGDNNDYATVSFDLADGNTKPVADGRSLSVKVNTSTAITLTGRDPDGDPLTYVVHTNPGNGVLSGTAPDLTYTPNTNYIGPDSFVFKVDDGKISAFATVSITVPATASDYAGADIAVAGSVGGSRTDTQASDNVYQTLAEAETAGDPGLRYSYLEHKWLFNLMGGATVTFHVEAHHSANSEGDDFVFAYSTTGVNGTYQDMVTVTKTSDDNTTRSFVLPPGTGGLVHVRVVDTNRDAGNRNLDSIHIDKMYFLSEGGLASAMYAPDTEVWAASYGEADLSDPAADLDGDGLSNGEERIWGLDPTNPASFQVIQIPLDPMAGSFRYTRRDRALTGLTYTVWTSTDLTDWSEDVGASEKLSAPDANHVETVTVTLSSSQPAPSTRFVRVRAGE